MKKIFYLILISASLVFVACTGNNDSKDTKEYVLKLVEEKGIDNISWSDFNHLEHEDVGSGNIVIKYKLKNAELLLVGLSYDEHPKKIVILEKNVETVLKEWK